MRFLSIAALLLAPAEDEGAQLVRDALREQLNGAPGPACAKFRELRERAIRAHNPRVWQVYGTSAVRRDGVRIEQLVAHPYAGAARDTLSTPPWIVAFPPSVGGRHPSAYVPRGADAGRGAAGDAEGFSLAEAMASVDARWPMAGWWGEVDAYDINHLPAIVGSVAP